MNNENLEVENEVIVEDESTEFDVKVKALKENRDKILHEKKEMGIRLKAIESELEEERAKFANLEKFASTRLIESVVKPIADWEAVQSAQTLYMKEMMQSIKLEYKDNDFRFSILDSEGQPTEMKIEDLAKDMRDRPELATIIVGSRASGGGATESGGGSGYSKVTEKMQKANVAFQLGKKHS
ncbi:MAG: hypothetical protein AAGJ37_02580 [Pseudomonadota bacterium]